MSVHVDEYATWKRAVEARTPSSVSYPAYVKALNPWLYWQMDDANGASDVVDSGNPSTVIGGASWGEFGLPPPNNSDGPFNVEGTLGIAPGAQSDGRTCLECTGSGQQGVALVVPSASDNVIASELFIALSVQATYTSGNAYAVAQGFISSFSTQVGCYIGYNTGWPGVSVSPYSFTVDNGDNLHGVQTFVPVTLDGKWHLLCINYVLGSGSDITATTYWDGVKQAAQLLHTGDPHSYFAFSEVGAGYVTVGGQGVDVGHGLPINYQDYAVWPSGGAVGCSHAFSDSDVANLFTAWQDK